MSHGLPWVGCKSTGKRGYWSKRDARRARSRQTTPDLHIYRCDVCGRFHLGHLATAVRAGVVSRADHYAGPQ